MIRASVQDGTYPRPQLVREEWASLDGEWEFAVDDDDAGLRERWFASESPPFGARITVPFCPESELSGIGDTGFHSIVWYRRTFTVDPSAGERVILHFGAVDHSCRVWVDGGMVGDHVGGQSSFSFDVTDALGENREHTIVVRALDDPRDLEVPRGKQDWQEKPHAIWYTRTTGIWRTVWLEKVPALHISGVSWSSDLVAGTVSCEVTVSSARSAPATISVTTEVNGEPLVAAAVDVVGGTALIVLRPAGLRAGQLRESLLWSPEHPLLVDAAIELNTATGPVDRVASYFGIRSVEAVDGRFQLNGVPYFVRAVLEQGYWPESIMTAPDAAALRREVELIRALGFNTARIHQKVEDPRFLYWADRLGLMVWGESAAAYDFSPRAVTLFAAEWADVVARDRSHPSLVAWVPMNESWGVQDISRSRPQREFVQAIVSLTRALDPFRPVISNDGWEHIDSDILTIHDYSPDAKALTERYGTASDAIRTALTLRPQHRTLVLTEALAAAVRDGRTPIMVSEFGGVSFSGDGSTWGYALVDNEEDYRDLLAGLFGGLNHEDSIAGHCYTQLTDTGQEANGLLRADRTPKLPIETIREIVTGRTANGRHFVWPPITE